MSEFTFRPAETRDLGAVNAIFAEAQTGAAADAPAAGLPIFRHELTRADLWIAERAGAVVGFAASVRRSGRTFLAELFVRADERSRGLGGALLERCFTDDGSPRATLGSSDARALALYVRSGLEPRWPLFYLVGEAARLRLGERRDGIERQPATASEVEALDAGIGGRRRPADLDFWLVEGRAEISILRRGADTIGYAVLRRRSDDWIGNEAASTLGPAGVRDPADATGALFASLAAPGETVRIALPGPHPALGALLDAGFTIAEVDVFLATPGALGFDPRAYLPSGGALF